MISAKGDTFLTFMAANQPLHNLFFGGFMPTQAQKTIQITSIIMIVGGILGFILSLVALSGIGTLMYFLGSLATLLLVASIISLLAAAFEAYVGFIGMKNYMNPPMAKKLLTFGLVIIGIQVISLILSIAAGSFPFISFIIGLILPGLFCLGNYRVMTGKPNLF